MLRGIDKWLLGYADSVCRRPRRAAGTRHLLFCVADHFEPFGVVGQGAAEPGHGRTRAEREAVVRRWVEQYPGAVSSFRDADGRPPRHTFFISPDDCEPGWVEQIAELCGRGFGEIELHLHHRNDTVEGLRQKLVEFRDRLRKEHGLLGSWKTEGRGQETGVRSESGIRHPASGIAYAFVHGNWALCNSRPDGDWCGVNEELSVLAGTGCYADFTFPSAPSPTQPRMVNAIYRAWDRAEGRGADAGVRVQVSGFRCQGADRNGKFPIENSQFEIFSSGFPLMLIQGPLALDWRRRKWGVLPRLDTGGITHHNPPTSGRADLWVDQAIHVAGRPEWVFVKVYAHGMIPSSSRVLLGEPMRRLHEHLQVRYNDGHDWKLHYVTAREMFNVVRAAEDGASDDPGARRDYEVAPPPASSR